MKKNTSNYVIEALLFENGLSLKELQKKVATISPIQYSYHSIYKSIEKLLKEEVVTKEDNKHKLNSKWINENIKFYRDIKRHKRIIEGNEDLAKPSNMYEFEKLDNLYLFLRKFEDKNLALFKDNKEDKIIWIVHHAYNFLLQPSKELEHINSLKELGKKLLILCSGDTQLDRWTKKNYENMGAEMKTGVDAAKIVELNLYKSQVVQIFYCNKFRKALDEIYFKNNDINELDISKIFGQLKNNNFKINVSIFNSAESVLALRNQAIGMKNR